MPTGFAFYVTLPPSTRFIVRLVVAPNGVVSFATPGPPVEEVDEHGVPPFKPYPPLRSMKVALASIQARDIDRIIAYVPRAAGTNPTAHATCAVKLTVAICTDEAGEATLFVEDEGVVEADHQHGCGLKFGGEMAAPAAALQDPGTGGALS
ncbi:hypothetical protein FA95DRAFT_1612967 [Auriscalpium vulgare]|uniref:Uncharacterized protein n=1 Tax=Auriscalpium vulgare TaxID=40419 RepID=A0ACB8R4K9_9AGAM|nr:hypothetical protein FA95DRAFT_1612967 [Auriscalpium vulgare]